MKRIILLLSSVMIFSVQGFSQSIRYVSPNGTALAQNAVSWTSACSDLQAVINVSQSGDIIWVAQGTYKPIRQAFNLSMIEPNNRCNAFVLKAGVKIYGGFVGNETSLEQRVLPIMGNQNASILSGDIGIIGDNTDNCFHVVISAGDSTDAGMLDGFVICEGHANAHRLDSKMQINKMSINNGYGSGVYIHTSSPILSNIIIKNNTTTNHGGGMYINNSSPALINVIIHNNIADYGGGIYTDGKSFPVFTNCTFANNTARTEGGAIGVSVGWIYIRNTIIWGNTAKIGPAIGGTNYSLSYSIVQGTTASDTNLGNVNPRFVNAGIGDYRLLSGSPAINAGSNTYFHADSTPNLSQITKDLKGSPRFEGSTVDIGAYEYFAPSADANGVIYVTANGRTTGQSWTDATSLADALYLAQTDNTIKQIWVAKGTYAPLYNPENSIHPRQNTFVLTKDIKLYGGFAGGETSINERDWKNNETLLSGIMGSDTAYHVVVAAGELGDVLVDGFTITDGNALTVSGTTSINGKTIEKKHGGAMYVDIKNSELTVQNCMFRNNKASFYGGAIYNINNSKVNIFNTNFRNNKAGYAGATFNGSGSQMNINRCNFTENTAKLLGGAVHSTGTLTVANSLFTYNNAENGGAFDFYGNATLVNLTIADNSANSTGGGIYTRSGNVNLQNSILYNNTALENGNLSKTGGMIHLSYCALDNWEFPVGFADSGNNLTGIDPLFVDAQYNNYSIQIGSPCYNQGNNNLYLSALNISDFSEETDLAGNSRFLNNIIDIGAFEGSATSLKEILGSDMLLYPNPVRNTLYLQTLSDVEQITFYDISGRIIKQVQNSFKAIDVNDLHNGIYLVKVKTKEREVVWKIVKE